MSLRYFVIAMALTKELSTFEINKKATLEFLTFSNSEIHTRWTQSLFKSSFMHLSKAPLVSTSMKCLACLMLFNSLSSNLPAANFSTSKKTVKPRNCKWTFSKLQHKFTIDLLFVKSLSKTLRNLQFFIALTFFLNYIQNLARLVRDNFFSIHFITQQLVVYQINT